MRITHKLVVGLVAALLLIAGPAVADPYPGTVRTTTTATGKDRVELNHRPATKVKVTAGNASPSGRLELTYKRLKGGFSAEKTVRYAGERVTVTGPRLPKTGRYEITVRFVPKSGSVYKKSSDSYRLKVVK